MSSSCRNGLPLAGAVFAIAGAGVAQGAQNYVQPLVEVSAEQHSNRGLQIEDTESLTAYQFDGALVFGFLTPTAETQIRPRIVAERFSDNDRFDNEHYMLDVVSNWESPRNSFGFVAKYLNQDTFSTQLIEPGFDDIDPGDPGVGDPGRIAIDNEITRVQLRGDYGHRVSERTGIGFDAVLETVGFDTQVPGERVDYDYGRVGATFERELSERTNFYLGPYVARYEAQDDSYLSDGVGLRIGFDFQVSQTLRATLDLMGERDNIERTFFEEETVFIPTPPFVITQLVEVTTEDETTEFGGTVGFLHEGPISRFRFNIGRTIAPSARGANVTVDQLRGEYDRALSPRLGLNVAARVLRDDHVRRALLEEEEDETAGERRYATASVSLRWQMTPRWYLTGGFEEIWQDFESDPDSANDHTFFAGFGYTGLGAQR